MEPLSNKNKRNDAGAQHIIAQPLAPITKEKRQPFGLSLVRYRYKLSNFPGRLPRRWGVLPLARRMGRIKTEGKEQSALRHRAIAQSSSVPLIPPIMASNPFKFAFAPTYIRPHFDNSHNLHPYGDVNRSGSCSSFHWRIILLV